MESPPPHARSVKPFNNGKHVWFIAWGLLLPRTSWLCWGSGAVRGSRPLMESHDFLSWLSFVLTLPACLPPLPLTLAGVELSSSTHSRGGNKSQWGEAWYSYEKDSKERYRGMHHISEPVPIIQMEWCSTLKHATNQLGWSNSAHREAQTLNCRSKKEGTLNTKVRWAFLEWWKIHPPMSVLLLHCPHCM